MCSSFYLSYHIFILSTSSKRSVISLDGGLPIRLTMMIAIEANRKPGMISYSPQSANCFQISTVRPPTTIPARAPLRVVRRQNNENSSAGPKAAPKPAQAYATISSMRLSGFIARAIAMAEIASTDIRLIHTSSDE